MCPFTVATFFLSLFSIMKESFSMKTQDKNTFEYLPSMISFFAYFSTKEKKKLHIK